MLRLLDLARKRKRAISGSETKTGDFRLGSEVVRRQEAEEEKQEGGNGGRRQLRRAEKQAEELRRGEQPEGAARGEAGKLQGPPHTLGPHGRRKGGPLGWTNLDELGLLGMTGRTWLARHDGANLACSA